MVVLSYEQANASILSNASATNKFTPKGQKFRLACEQGGINSKYGPLAIHLMIALFPLYHLHPFIL